MGSKAYVQGEVVQRGKQSARSPQREYMVYATFNNTIVTVH